MVSQIGIIATKQKYMPDFILIKFVLGLIFFKWKVKPPLQGIIMIGTCTVLVKWYKGKLTAICHVGSGMKVYMN